MVGNPDGKNELHEPVINKITQTSLRCTTKTLTFVQGLICDFSGNN